MVDRAFRGADAVFWLAPPNFNAPSIESPYREFARPACDALEKHGVKHVVGVSALGRGVRGLDEKAGLVSGSLAMDDLIASTGVSFRALALPGFMDNILRSLDSIQQQGTFSWPIVPTLKLPHCATSDIAAVASKLLLDRSWSGRADLPILGPEDLSFDELAQIVSDVLQRPVRYQPISMAEFKSNLLQHGASEAVAQGMVDMFDAKNKGLDHGVRRSAETSSPTSFRTFCEQVLKPMVLA